MKEQLNHSDNAIRPTLALTKEDVGDMDSILRGYYRSQINSLEKRKDRKLARQLLQDHLILPKSRQRTSKDAAYIKEILDIDINLLSKLEDSRLIRRIHKGGTNPIYEVSHDTLVEPILAERNNSIAIRRFLKRVWPFLILLLLLWFLLGMLFENTFEVVPAPFRTAQNLAIQMDQRVIGIDENPRSLMLSFQPFPIDQKLYPSDSLLVTLPIKPVDLGRIRQVTRSGAGDTISIIFSNPIEVPVGGNSSTDTYHTFSNLVVPIASLHNADGKKIYAKVSGNLKMTEGNDDLTEKGIAEYDQMTSLPIEVQLGDTLLRAAGYARSVPVSFSLQLSDLFENDIEKANVKNILGDRIVNLNYTVKVGATPAAPSAPEIELPSVKGVEVQYSDGTKRFIPSPPNNPTPILTPTQEVVHVVAAKETLFSIAKKYNLRDASGKISTAALMQLNGLTSNTIAIGQVLRIPGN